MRHEEVFSDLAERVRQHGIAVSLQRLDVETPGTFDGPSITVNSAHDPVERCFHLAHAFGSIVAWSVDLPHATGVFAELRAAKRARIENGPRFENALVGFAGFEEAASEYAVWFLLDTGHGHLIESYTTFFRADLDAMLIFHRKGVAPVWQEFLAAWKRDLARGARTVTPYTPRAVPRFVPVRIPRQDVVQEHDGEP